MQLAPDITQGALEESDPLAVEAVDLFLAILGAEAGYMGLRILASGGIYICGGIVPRVRSRAVPLCHISCRVAGPVCKGLISWFSVPVDLMRMQAMLS